MNKGTERQSARSSAAPLAPAVRDGESPRTWFRSGRVYWDNGHYFITTREGIDVGPYDEQQEAERDARRLVELLSEVEDPVKARLLIYEFRNRPKGGFSMVIDR